MPQTTTKRRQITIAEGNNLASLARQYGTSVQSLVDANRENTAALPDPSNPNLIRAGAPLFLPGQGVQQTDTALRSQLDEAGRQLNDILARIQTQESRQQAAEPRREPEPEPTPTDPLTSSIRAIEERGSRELADVERTFGEARKFANQSSNALIDSIRQLYQARIDETKEANRRLYQTKETIGIRAGRSRYTPGHEAGNLTGEEIAGQERIARWTAEMNNAVAVAEQARIDNDFRMLSVMYDRMQTTQKQINNEIAAQYDRAFKENEARRKAEQEDFARMLDYSGRVAPSLAAELAAIQSPEERAAILQEVAGRAGIDPNILAGDVEGALMDRERRSLELANIRGTIASRNLRDQIAIQEFNRSNIPATGIALSESGGQVQASAPPKAPTAGESAAFTFFTRMKDAIDALDAVEQEVNDAGLLGQLMLKGPNILKSDELQVYSQAMRQFTEARLRKDSGAAIPPEEFENDRRMYFPQPGDSDSVLERKRQARETTLNALRTASGNAYWDFYGEDPVIVARRMSQVQKDVDGLPAAEGNDPLGINN